jgi:hypothetical protein
MPDSGGDASRAILPVPTFESKGCEKSRMLHEKTQYAADKSSHYQIVIRHVVRRKFDVAVEM